jgi:hypothetical protein
VAVAVAVACLLPLSVAGCLDQGIKDQVNSRMFYGMRTSEVKIAEAAAIHLARTEDAHVTARAFVSAAAAPASTSASPGPPPEPCTTGRLLHITLAGEFPHHRVVSRTDATPVSGQVMTVDATTGRVCETHYMTGPVLSDPMSVLLFSS